MATTASDQRLVCSGCRRAIEWCAVCDRENCQAALCYACLVKVLREPVRQQDPRG
jgi:hypothetical protein